ncbi:hypothetical protein [Psychromarinibacter sp. S121]|uniref:hypothetical protein n=1 Tax=Psychromarinibacter sp. S121 TaxID=3415127 RepID=UPI003C7D6842
MTKPKLLLHPGSSQGGSTWIQNLCGRNPEVLTEQHFHYLHDFRKLPFEALGTDDPAPFHAALDTFLDRDAPQGGDETVFLSNENALGDPMRPGGLFAKAPAMARVMLPLFDHFGAAQVIYVWRPLDRFLLSAYNQRKKQGNKITFAAYADTVAARNYDSRHVIEALRILSERAEVTVIDFEFLVERPRRFAAEFFRLSGVVLPEGFDYVQDGRNPSIRPEGIKILEHAKDFLERKEYMDLRKFVQARFPKTGFTGEEQSFLDDWAGRSAANEKMRLAELGKFARLIRVPPKD